MKIFIHNFSFFYRFLINFFKWKSLLFSFQYVSIFFFFCDKNNIIVLFWKYFRYFVSLSQDNFWTTDKNFHSRFFFSIQVFRRFSLFALFSVSVFSMFFYQNFWTHKQFHAIFLIFFSNFLLSCFSFNEKYPEKKSHEFSNKEKIKKIEFKQF